MSVFDQDRIPGVPGRYALGLWLPRRKIASSGFVPGQRSRQLLRGGRPYWYVFNFTLGASQTLESQQSCPTDFIATAIYISDSAGGTPTNPGCRLQLFDTKRKKRMSLVGINDVNFGGTARDPFILRRPYRFRAAANILMRVQNLQTSSNTVQVVLQGVQDA